ncbi:uncharacterized protein LOC123451882 isoform X1 [Hordeum vulgare subsp. vulgare]|uniref:uncharacterized protein LOC123451882 isoform X1 n=1 Tax=Hordeum vulgare subsp. vulgare TaxID=112509 RepID=UPI001D1A3D4D|nr:uncharacterized protein LOC123451882 isoform X1 [Hordeum vulgare subsp. vulgare]
MATCHTNDHPDRHVLGRSNGDVQYVCKDTKDDECLPPAFMAARGRDMLQAIPRQRWQLEGASLRGRQGQEDVGEEGSAAVPDEDGHHRRRQRVPDRRPTRRDEEGRERRRQIPAGPRSPERSLPR